jgi:1,4-dihydroxy-2-naphthoate octaprenyltransferase
MENEAERPGRLKTWLIAVRPFAYPASVFGVLLGLALALYEGHPFRALPFLASFVGVLCVHTAANLLNDFFDYEGGVDTEVHPGSGALVRGLLTPGQVFRGALLCLLVAGLIGLWLFSVAGWVIPALAAVGVLLAFGYTAPRLSLKFIGLGEVTMILAFGPLVVLGVYWVQAEQFSWAAILWGILPGELTAAVLHTNNWRDVDEDRAQGCRTVAGVLGDRASLGYYALLLWAPFALTVLYVVLARTVMPGLSAPLAALVVFVSAPIAVKLQKAASARHTEGGRSAFGMLDARTAQLQLVFGLLLVLGFLASAALGW